MIFMCLLVCAVQIELAYSMPVHPWPLLPPLMNPLQAQLMRDQIMQAQAFEELHNLNGFKPVKPIINIQQPPIIVIVNTPPSLFTNNISNMKENLKNDNTEKPDLDIETDDEDLESVVIEAHPEKPNQGSHLPQTPPTRAIILLPNGRGIIGDIVALVPFLPFEINVPDTISWIYDRIREIIAGIGQKHAFRGKPMNEEISNEIAMKLYMKYLQPNNWQRAPIFVIPLMEEVFPLGY